MAIKYLPTLGDTPREFQRAMAEVGRIRLGRFDPNKGRRGAPDKLDRFRFTSDSEELIREVAREYGGEPAQYTPQRSNKTGWEVISEASTVDILLPPQTIEPWNEAWRPGLCIRRCDGEWEVKNAEEKGLERQPCLCNAGQVGTSDLCKPTIRVKVMLPNVPPGLGTWRLESHGEYACSELDMLAPIAARLQALAPAVLTLRAETRRRWNAEKGKHDTLEFYVPTVLLNSATPALFAEGGSKLVQALQAKGGIALDGTPQPALAAAPAPGGDTPAEATWLEWIEAARDVDQLTTLQRQIKDAGMGTRQVIDAWKARLRTFTLTQDTPSAAEVEPTTGVNSRPAAAEQPGSVPATHVNATGSEPKPGPAAEPGTAAEIDAGIEAFALHRGEPVQQTRAWILQQIELCTTTDALDGLRDKLKARNIKDPQVRGSWASKRAAVVEHHQTALRAAQRAESERLNQAARQSGTDAQADRNQGAPPPEWAVAGQVEGGGTLYTAPVDTPEQYIPEYQVGDTVTVGGVEFTKIGDNPFPPGTPAATTFAMGEPVDAEIVYDANEEFDLVFMAAGGLDWTTAQVHNNIKAFCKVEKSTQATGAQLHAMREAMRRGELK